jgi:chorismate synthase
LCAVIENGDARSEDYEAMRDIPRPSHADFAAYEKYGMNHDIKGGGLFSGRLTAPLCVAGAICLQILQKRGIAIGSHIASIGDIEDTPFDSVNPDVALFSAIAQKPFPVIDDAFGQKMLETILQAASEGDSIGGVVEGCATGVPSGLGQPMFDGIENVLAKILFGIPAVKGVEFGNGFACAKLRGSQNNDAFYYNGNGKIKTRTNAHGGSLGGITSGMPILVRAAFKPTPSIGIEQQSVSLKQKKDAILSVRGRHDPCIVPRAVPCVEAAMAIALTDLLLQRAAETNF